MTETNWTEYAAVISAEAIALTGNDSIVGLAGNNCIDLMDAPDEEYYRMFCASLHGLLMDRGYPGL